MTDLASVSVRISNYKCFGSEGQGYDGICPINLIIGRNNTGKSTLLDLIEYLIEPKNLGELGHKGQPPQVILSDVLDTEDIQHSFPMNTSGGSIPGNHFSYGSRWIGARIDWRITPSSIEFVAVDPPFDNEGVHRHGYDDVLARHKGNPFTSHVFKRLRAERDIAREMETPNLTIGENGAGATNVIQQYINKANLPSDLIEKILLAELNAIFEPDASFTRIVVQQLNTQEWEVYLEETEKGRIPLSHTGSGVKTVLLVLLFLYVVPNGQSLSRYMFGFEELENNLHPAIQRRLLTYLRKIAVKEGCRIFLTTHSHIAIDLFANDDQAQILHVTHNKECAAVRRVSTYVDNKGVLDDLDVRASDLLQANGIVWVEGPSDRLYFNRWIELVSRGQLKEGINYQCVFYGGRLLAHLSADDPNVDLEEAVKILKINRNAAILIDSDKTGPNTPISDTKERIRKAIQELDGLAWITAGNEIENYIPYQAFLARYPDADFPALKPYQDIANYLNKIKIGEGKRFLRNKVLFAEQMRPLITLEGIADTLDLQAQIQETCRLIRRWNKLPER